MVVDISVSTSGREVGHIRPDRLGSDKPHLRLPFLDLLHIITMRRIKSQPVTLSAFRTTLYLRTFLLFSRAFEGGSLPSLYSLPTPSFTKDTNKRI